MEGVNPVNTTMALTGIILCLVGILQANVGSRINARTGRFFLLFYSCLLAFDVMNLLGQVLRGRPGGGIRIALYVTNFLEFFLPSLLVFIMSHYLLSIVDADRKQTTIRTVLPLLVAIHLALLGVSQFTGLYYVIDAHNVYHRSDWYPLSYLMPAAMILLDMHLLIRYRNRLTGPEITAFWLYLSIPILAIVLQIFLYGIYFVVFATIIAALIMYVFIISDQTERFFRQEQENARLKTDILLAQIQPHFLFNSLTVIKALVRRDPAQADEAIGKFTDYLRYNMDSLTEDRLIPFSREMEHVERYLELQKLRFQDALEVEYDLLAWDFSLPTLTVQPLVENAVTYGVRRSETGTGKVTVRSRAWPDRVEVSVIDTGPGFEPAQALGELARGHIGIENVRARLRHACGGELVIRFAPGEGTTATVILPRRG